MIHQSAGRRGAARAVAADFRELARGDLNRSGWILLITENKMAVFAVYCISLKVCLHYLVSRFVTTGARYEIMQTSFTSIPLSIKLWL